MDFKINFNKIFLGVFVFLAILGLLQLMKDSASSKNRSIKQNMITSPAGSPWPSSWVRWEDIFEEVSVSKFGPKYSEDDFVITLPTNIVNSLPDGSSCVGDSDLATCLVGTDLNVKKVFEEWSNFY